MKDFLELNAIRGLSPRQQRLLALEALAEGTAYDTLEPWDAVNSFKEPLPCRERKPAVQIGLVREKVTKLVRRLSGAKARPDLDGVEAIETELAEAQVMRTLSHAARDLVVKGSCALGFARLASGRFEPLYLDSVWCEPLFVSQASGERARQLREELAALGVQLAPAPEGGLAVPQDAESHDLVFLRHEWVRDEEVAAKAGGQPRTTKRTRYRRDYLPDVILEYAPIVVGVETQTAPDWRLAERPRPHGWGTVPIVWVRAPGARPGDVDGPSLISPELVSLAVSADYLESMAGDSVAKIAWPQLVLIDLKDKVREINDAFDATIETTLPASSAYVLDLKSSGQHQGKAELLEIRGDGPKVAAEHVQRLAKHVERLTGLIEHDQAAAAGTLSGVALERMLEPLVSTVDEWRGPLGDGLVLYAQKLAKVLGRQVTPTVRWPRVVTTTPADLVAAAQALSTATGGQPVMSRETAARIFAQLVEIEDVDAELKRLDADADDALARAREAMSQVQKPTTPTEE